MPTVLRATDQNLATGSVAFNFDDMAAQAKSYLDQVRAEAAKIVAKAQQEAAAVREAGRGRRPAGGHDGVEQMIAKQLGHASSPPCGRRSRHPPGQAGVAGPMGGERRPPGGGNRQAVIRSELTRQPEIPLTLIREALELAAGSGEIRVHLNPDDHQAWAARCRCWCEEMSGLGETQIVADAGDLAGRLPRGDPLRHDRSAVRGPVGPHEEELEGQMDRR